MHWCHMFRRLAWELEVKMWVWGERAASLPHPLNVAAAERHKDNNTQTITGGSVHSGDVGQLCKDPSVEFY